MDFCGNSGVMITLRFGERARDRDRETETDIEILTASHHQLVLSVSSVAYLLLLKSGMLLSKFLAPCVLECCALCASGCKSLIVF